MIERSSPPTRRLTKSNQGVRGAEPSDEMSGQVSILSLSYDSEVLRTVAGVLESNPLGPISFGNNAAAEDMFRRVTPDMVILDLGNQAERQLETLQTLRLVDRDALIILVAESQDREVAIRGLEAGAYDFVEKPLDTRLLGFALRRGAHIVRSARSEQSHRRRLEETVEETNSVIRRKDFLQGILDSSTLVSVVLTDLSQEVLFWNTGAQNIFGYSSEEMLGHKVTRIYPADAFTSETVEKLREMVAGKSGTVYGKMRQITKDGREVIVSLALSPMLDPSGELQGILGVGLDVTEETHLHGELVKSLAQIKLTQDVSVFSLAKLAECRDEETGLHLIRIQNYCRSLAHGLGRREEYREMMSPEFIEDLVRSSVLHDIGKVGIPDAVLLANGKFTPEEFEIMKRHPVIGGSALEEAVKELGEDSYLCVARDVAYYHHEKWDGSGYPFGLKGSEVPLSARIVAVADVYDALTSQRRYKRAFSHEEAINIIVEGRSKHFDPDLVDVFVDVEAEFMNIRSTFS